MQAAHPVCQHASHLLSAQVIQQAGHCAVQPLARISQGGTPLSLSKSQGAACAAQRVLCE